MRHAASNVKSSRPPVVGTAVEAVSGYGRSILRGVLRYANLQRTWVLHKDLWHQMDNLSDWPYCDGAIIAGVQRTVFDHIYPKCKYAVTCSNAYDAAVAPVIAVDDHATGVMAAEHLISCGLKHFAEYSARSRIAGFRQAVEAKGYSCIDSVIRDPDPSYDDLFTHAHHPTLIKWLKSLPKPIGIFAWDDTLASDLSEACREAGIAVPDKVAIIGVNNDDLLCESAWPPLSSIECDFSRMGYLAAKLLDRMLKGETIEPQERHMVLPPLRVVQRMSTSILAVDNIDLSDAVRYIREHACDPCSVTDILRIVPIQRRQLERKFLQDLGRTIHDEISGTRMDTARRLLQQPDMTMPEIAERCGFSALQSFHRFFTDKEGVTPAVYRRQILSSS